MKSTRTLDKEKNKSILKSAITEFNRVGYDATSMDRIATGANVSKVTIYKHFGSKKKLFLSLMNLFKEKLNAYPYIEYSQRKSIRVQLEEFAYLELKILSDIENMQLSRLAINVLMNKCDVTQETQSIKNNPMIINLIDWFSKAKEDGKLHFDDVNFVVQQFNGNIKNFAFYPQLYGAEALSPSMYDAIVENAVDIILFLYNNRKKN